MKQIQIDNNNWVTQLVKANFEKNDFYPIIDIADDEFEMITNTADGYKWKYNSLNNSFSMEPYDLELLKQRHLEDVRYKRKMLLAAFDIYKTNVFYSIESDGNHQNIISWYQQILDLNEEAINNPPAEIEKYLQQY